MIDKNEHKSFQGLFVLLMIILHLFCNLNMSNAYKPIIYIFNIPISYYIAILGDCCVFGFAFLSGYSLTLLDEKENFKNKDYYKKQFKKIIRLLVNYWIILLLFSLISILISNGHLMPGSFKEFFANLFLISNSYNGAWWYLPIYIYLVLLFPILKKIVNKYPILSLFVFFLIYLISYYLRIKSNIDNFVFVHLYLLGMSSFEFLIGIYFFKFSILSKLEKYNKKIIFLILLFLILLLFFARTLFLQSLFFAPLSGLVIILLFHCLHRDNYILSFIGKHSTNIWLVHMFFYKYIFIDLVYIAKYFVLIVFLMLFLCIITSYIIIFIEKIIYSLFERGT